MPTATLIAVVDAGERAVLDAWLERWRQRLAYCSENEGCGCCVDVYRVDAPLEALGELPEAVVAWEPEPAQSHPQTEPPAG
jgi:hypothetical protein